MRISVVIPVYEMHGKGEKFLKRALESTKSQTFKDYDIIVSDNSSGNKLKNLCKDLIYIRNPWRIGMAANTNFALTSASGQLIKILYQDDYLAHNGALQEISDNFTESDSWLVTACSNNPNPFYSVNNTLGSPSCLTIRNIEPLLFNEKLKWCLDLDYYHRMYKKFGEPKILLNSGVVIGLGSWQETNNLSEEIKRKEEYDTRIAADHN